MAPTALAGVGDQLAAVQSGTPALDGLFQQTLRSPRFPDHLVQFRVFAPSHGLPAISRCHRSVSQERSGVFECEADVVAQRNQAKKMDGVPVVTALPAHAHGRLQEANLVVIAQRGRSVAGSAGELADGQQLRHVYFAP